MAGSQATRDWSCWVNRATLVGSVGVCAGAFLWGPTHLVAVGVPVALIVAVAHFLSRGDHDGSLHGWSLWRSILRVSVCGTALLMSVSVTAALSPALSLLLVLVLLASTPPMCTRLLRVWDAVPAARPDPPAPTARVQALSDAELCQEWHRSSRELDRTPDVQRRVALAAARQLLLDEVWTRHRKELEAWVACGARAHDGTHRFYDVP